MKGEVDRACHYVGALDVELHDNAAVSKNDVLATILLNENLIEAVPSRHVVAVIAILARGGFDRYRLKNWHPCEWKPHKLGLLRAQSWISERDRAPTSQSPLASRKSVG